MDCCINCTCNKFKNLLNSKPAPDDKWPVYTLEKEQYISLSPASSIQAKMLPEKMAFWNLLVPSLTEPQPTLVPSIPTSPVTSRPPGQAAAVTDKGKALHIWCINKW